MLWKTLNHDIHVQSYSQCMCMCECSSFKSFCMKMLCKLSPSCCSSGLKQFTLCKPVPKIIASCVSYHVSVVYVIYYLSYNLTVNSISLFSAISITVTGGLLTLHVLLELASQCCCCKCLTDDRFRYCKPTECDCIREISEV